MHLDSRTDGVIPAKAGIQESRAPHPVLAWIPAGAGMTRGTGPLQEDN